MSALDELRASARRPAIWATLAVVAAVAFGLGTCVGAPADEGSADEGDAHAGHAHDGDDEPAQVWTCSMHPSVRRDGPGECPICGMDLVPASSVDAGGEGEVVLSERARTLARVRTARVERAGGSGLRRLSGRVTWDEGRLGDVVTWASGRIERLRVDTTGERVRRGQVVADMYSPEIHAAHRDLLVAKRHGALGGAVDAIRSRLRLLGVSPETLARMEAADAPWERVPVVARQGGVVVERRVTEGETVPAGATLLRVADPRRLWIVLDAYASDLPHLAVGQPVTVEVRGAPDVAIEAPIDFVDPELDPVTRVAEVRLRVTAPDGALEPGLYVDAVVETGGPGDGPPPLVVPASAPLFTGARSLVYVTVPGTDRPTYAPREVDLGPRLRAAGGDVYPVRAGLAEGEEVVVHGAFALDADLQIQGGPAMMTRPDDTTRPDALPAHLADVWRATAEAYADLAAALAADDLEAARAAGGRLATATAGAGDAPGGEALAALGPEARVVADAADFTAARAAFEPLSAAVLARLDAWGNPLEDPLRRAWCPMAMEGRGAFWAQRDGELRNPYYGADMLTCGELRQTFEAAR